MTGYIADIETKTKNNDFFREVLFTGTHMQLVVMSLKAGEEIGLEVHDHVDQFFRVESGTGQAILSGEVSQISDGSVVIVPAGVEHNIINTSSTESLKLYTIYSPANHPKGTIHKTKAEAMAAEAEEHR